MSKTTTNAGGTVAARYSVRLRNRNSIVQASGTALGTAATTTNQATQTPLEGKVPLGEKAVYESYAKNRNNEDSDSEIAARLAGKDGTTSDEDFQTPEVAIRGNRAPSEEVRGMIRTALGKEKPSKNTGTRSKPQYEGPAGGRVGIRPAIKQIDKHNYINSAFDRLRNLNKSIRKSAKKGRGRGDPSDDSSSDCLDDTGRGRRSNRRNSRNNRRKNRNLSSDGDTPAKKAYKVKAVPLSVIYDGRAHLPTLHQHITKVCMYLEDLQVPENRQVRWAALFIKETAYDWYIREVAANVDVWKLEEYFYAMYDHCFPVDFKEKQQAKLERYEQRGLTVRDMTLEVVIKRIGTIKEGTTVDEPMVSLIYHVARVGVNLLNLLNPSLVSAEIRIVEMTPEGINVPLKGSMRSCVQLESAMSAMRLGTWRATALSATLLQALRRALGVRTMTFSSMRVELKNFASWPRLPSTFTSFSYQ
ncbi:hypothetical protein H1R20_g6929, partial [Candolleomyces eurysporus]